MYQRLVVPVDGTAGSETAVPVALALAQAFSAEVIVCHVVTTPAGAKSSSAPYDAARYVSDVAARFIENGVAAKTQLQRGDPARQIHRTAVAWGADAIVMATRSRRRVEKLVLGSVADSVVRDCHLPVLLVSQRGRKAAKSVAA
jgi:nucleotide-binding universal stress UspA family protein